MIKNISFFMGANTPVGFVSLFDGLYDPYGSNRCYILKGGPGSGKSTFMRRVAAAAQLRGLQCEYIYCASDPESLDAVIIPERHLCFVDGTAPHIIEPKFPGAVEQLVNLGAFWDESILEKKVDRIRELTVKNSALHSRCQRFISAAGVLRSDSQRICRNYIDEAKLRSYAVRFARRELKNIRDKTGKVSRRFLSAVTPVGVYAHSDSVRALCARVMGVEDEFAAVSGILLELIKNEALSLGYDVISCPCPMEPDGYPEHILIPSAGLALISMRSQHRLEVVPDRTIHVSRFITVPSMTELRRRNAFNKKASEELCDEAVRIMSDAKAVHDELESVYVKAMDFDAVCACCDKIIEKALL